MSSFLSKLLAQVHASHAKIDLPFHFTFKTASAPFVMKVNENNFCETESCKSLANRFLSSIRTSSRRRSFNLKFLLLTKHGSIMLELRLLY